MEKIFDRCAVLGETKKGTVTIIASEFAMENFFK